MEKWYAFKAYNSQTHYGYGTEEEAERYTQKLNENREINVYGAYQLSDEEAAEKRLDEGYGDSFNLSDEINS